MMIGSARSAQFDGTPLRSHFEKAPETFGGGVEGGHEKRQNVRQTFAYQTFVDAFGEPL